MEVNTAKFLDLLSKQINAGSDQISFEDLSIYFNNAVTALPDSQLKQSLIENETANFNKLWSLIKTSKKVSDEVTFNLLTPKGKEVTINNVLVLKSPTKRLNYLTQIALCSPSKEIFELILKEKHVQRGNENNLDNLATVIEVCSQLTIGYSNIEILTDFMTFFLTEVSKVFEEFNACETAEESWLKLKELITGFLTQCYFKRKKIQGEIKEYSDLIAAILSLYIDTVLKIDSRDESNLNQMSYLTNILLGDSTSFVLDAINQLSNMNTTTTPYLLPYLRNVLTSSLTHCNDFILYIKFICVMMKVLINLENENDILSLRKLSYSVSTNDGFPSWVSKQDQSLVQDLDLNNISKDKMTEHILKYKSEEMIERFLDLITEESKTKELVVNEAMPEEETGGETALFFVDSHGDTDMLENIDKEEESHDSHTDKLLKRQIDVVLQKLLPDSDSESGGFEEGSFEEQKEEAVEEVPEVELKVGRKRKLGI